MATKSSKVSLAPAFDALFNIAFNSPSSMFSPISSATLLIDSREVVSESGSSTNNSNIFLRSSSDSLSGNLLLIQLQLDKQQDFFHHNQY